MTTRWYVEPKGQYIWEVGDSTTGSILINAPGEAVVGVLADLAAYPDWTEGMSDVVILESRDGRPLRARFVVAGGPIHDTVELSYSWTNDQVNWTLLKGNTITAMNGCYKWSQQGTATQVTYELEIALTISLPGFIKRAAEKSIVTTALQGLKKRVEASL